MDVREREVGDAARLRALVRRERDALQRDRYRAALLALEGADEPTITEKLGRARRSVQAWVYAYRDGGIGALRPRPRPGRAPKLPRDRVPDLRARLDAGPRPEDGVCTLRGRDVRRILEHEFGVKYSLQGAYDLLHRLGYSCLAPRPRHEKQDPEAQRAFREESAPFLCGPSGTRWLLTAAGSASSSWMKAGSGSRAR